MALAKLGLVMCKTNVEERDWGFCPCEKTEYFRGTMSSIHLPDLERWMTSIGNKRVSESTHVVYSLFPGNGTAESTPFV
jgi:hypothetical protein